jgi:hypothetical protein
MTSTILPTYIQCLDQFEHIEEIKKIIDNNKHETVNYSLIMRDIDDAKLIFKHDIITSNIVTKSILEDMLSSNDYIVINGYHELAHLMKNNISLYTDKSQRDKLFFIDSSMSYTFRQENNIRNHDCISAGWKIQSGIRIESNKMYNRTTLSNRVQYVEFIELFNKYDISIDCSVKINKYYYTKNIWHYITSSVKQVQMYGSSFLMLGLEAGSFRKKMNHLTDNFPNKIFIIITNILTKNIKAPVNTSMIITIDKINRQTLSKFKIKKIKLMIFDQVDESYVIKNNIFSLVKFEKKKDGVRRNDKKTISKISVDVSSCDGSYMSMMKKVNGYITQQTLNNFHK